MEIAAAMSKQLLADRFHVMIIKWTAALMSECEVLDTTAHNYHTSCAAFYSIFLPFSFSHKKN